MGAESNKPFDFCKIVFHLKLAPRMGCVMLNNLILWSFHSLITFGKTMLTIASLDHSHDEQTQVFCIAPASNIPTAESREGLRASTAVEIKI